MEKVSLKQKLIRCFIKAIPSGIIKKIVDFRTFCYYRFFDRIPLPKTIIIDPVNICNLKCSFCPTGLDILNYNREKMKIETFKMIVDKIPFVKKICLFNWGEPFLNSDIFEMIKYAKEKGKIIELHSNFNISKADVFFDSLINSDLDRLYISLDGASQESYSKYRKGGSFNLAISNIRKLCDRKKELNQNHPEIIWKFLVNRYNENEIETAKNMAEELKVRFETAYFGLLDDSPDISLEASIEERKRQWLPKNDKLIFEHYRNDYKLPLYDKPCDQLITLSVINPDGKVFPCCWVTDKENIFGDLANDSFEKIWSNEKYSYSRSLFMKKKYLGAKTDTICRKCNNFKKT